ncbi:MAG: hypothetical protein LBS24_08380 [Clostridiales Family XIII bacterium]|nr:hypothetical protein [Clostridiales Family XIII bacterium]
MVDILKITSAIPATNRPDSLQRQLPGDAVFDINRPAEAPKYKVVERGQGEDPREALLRNLNKEFFAPLTSDLTAQMEGLKKLILFLRFFDNPQLAAKLGDIEGLFVEAKGLLDALLRSDKDATVFQGDLFEALRVLAKAEGFPKLQDAIVNLLRAFDSQVNRENSLRAVVLQGTQFASLLREEDANRVMELLNRIEASAQKPEQTPGLQKEIGALIKSELLPLLQAMATKYQFVNGEKLQANLMAIIHHVVRFDKSDVKLLENAMAKLGDELKSFGRLTDDDVADMRRMLFAHLREAKDASPRAAEMRGAAAGETAKDGGARAAGRGEVAADSAKDAPARTAGRGEAAADGAKDAPARTAAGGAAAEQAAELVRGAGVLAEGRRGLLSPEQLRAYLAGALAEDADADEAAKAAGDKAAAKDIAEVLRRAVEMNTQAKANTAAHSMLTQLIENESPVFALLHFLFPIRYLGEEVYTEVYVDKDCEERKKGADDAQNIFFIIQSDRFGSFEVDLLARERAIELDVKCPSLLTDDVRAIRGDLRIMIEALGYRLAAYTVDDYREDRTILQRFPKLAMRKAGIDVRI